MEKYTHVYTLSITIAFLIAADSISFRERGTPNCISTVDQHHDGAAS